MKLTDAQIKVLRQCALFIPQFIPITFFKGQQYIVCENLNDGIDLNIQGDVIAPLFESGYLEMSGKDTCIISDAGRRALECVQNSMKAE